VLATATACTACRPDSTVKLWSLLQNPRTE
jgi:hypothetical protein